MGSAPSLVGGEGCAACEFSAGRAGSCLTSSFLGPTYLGSDLGKVWPRAAASSESRSSGGGIKSRFLPTGRISGQRAPEPSPFPAPSPEGLQQGAAPAPCHSGGLPRGEEEEEASRGGAAGLCPTRQPFPPPVWEKFRSAFSSLTALPSFPFSREKNQGEEMRRGRRKWNPRMLLGTSILSLRRNGRGIPLPPVRSG